MKWRFVLINKTRQDYAQDLSNGDLFVKFIPAKHLLSVHVHMYIIHTHVHYTYNVHVLLTGKTCSPGALHRQASVALQHLRDVAAISDWLPVSSLLGHP